MSDTCVILKYTDDNGECHVSVHYDLEDARAYRARLIAGLVADGTVDDMGLADLLTEHLLNNEYAEAYEVLQQWLDDGEDAPDLAFVIQESPMLAPTTHMEVMEALNPGEDIEVEEIDLTYKDVKDRQLSEEEVTAFTAKLYNRVGEEKSGWMRPDGTICVAPPPLPKPKVIYDSRKQDVINRLDEVAREVKASGSIQTSAAALTPPVTVIGPFKPVWDEADDDDVMDTDALNRFLEATVGSEEGDYLAQIIAERNKVPVSVPEITQLPPVKGGRGVDIVHLPKRIDGKHGSVWQGVQKGVKAVNSFMEGLTEKFEPVMEEERPYPEVGHDVKTRGG